MQIYLVGGAVRDGLLGMPVAERDWVVVGAGQDALLRLGYRRADREFPVFLHPQTGEEYALARREIKTGPGYRGFRVETGPGVSLEEDLRRRDLTVNAMALDADGSLIDPFGGRADLDARLLRHVSPAFVEDPLRVLRVARFAAKLGRFGFRVAHPTQHLLRQMVAQGAMRDLPMERVWRELCAAMATERPRRFFEVLHACSALAELLPPLADAMGPWQAHAAPAPCLPLDALDRVAAQTADHSQRLAAVLFACLSAADEAEALLRRLRADRATVQLARRALAGKAACAAFAAQPALPALVELVQTWRAFDSPAQFEQMMRLCHAAMPRSAMQHWLAVGLPAARAVTVEQVRARGLSGGALGQALAAARHAAMAEALQAAGLAG
jgi:tRNA nucleotidyltransferase (CCA-adding enzyme)